MKKIIIYLAIICPFFVFSQEKNMFSEVNHIDIIKMKDGSLYQGKITAVKEDSITMEILGGFHLKLARKEIRNIVQKNLSFPNIEKQSVASYDFKENGLYNHLSVGLIGFDYNSGINASYSIGKMYKRTLGVGGGTGYYCFFTDNDLHKIIPIYAEARSYFRAKKTSPFASAKLGYGIALKRTQSSWEQPIDKQLGGLLLNPSFGFRFGANKDVNFIMDFGLVVQKVKETYILNNWGLGTSWKSYTFRRFNLNLGIVF